VDQKFIALFKYSVSELCKMYIVYCICTFHELPLNNKINELNLSQLNGFQFSDVNESGAFLCRFSIAELVGGQYGKVGVISDPPVSHLTVQKYLPRISLSEALLLIARITGCS